MQQIEDIIKPFWFNDVHPKDIDKTFHFLDDYYYYNKDIKNIKNDYLIYQKEKKFNELVKFGLLICVYKIGRSNGWYPKSNSKLESALKVNNVRENSGVMVFSIFTSAYPSYTKINEDGTKQIIKEFSDNNSENPGAFSCKYNCAYCPNEPNMPRSYLLLEPGVSRAAQHDFDAIRQVFARGTQYIQQGHPVDKIEVIIQGGTWDSYSIEYRTEFIRDIYYAFNTFMDYIFYKENVDYGEDAFKINNKILRPKKSLEEEIKINETAPCRVIGLTPETRPDQINVTTIKFLRKIGATRVQIGVQHLDDKILKHIERGCYKRHTIRAIQMLKDNGFKISIHLMLDLPYPDEYIDKMVEIDREMLKEFNNDPNFKIDQLKIYPCMVTQYTKIKEWYDNGIYKPYGELQKIDQQVWKRMTKIEKSNFRFSNPLYKTIFNFMKDIHSSIRIERVIRDIPGTLICGGTSDSGMRSEIDLDMQILGIRSNDIRSREACNHQNIKQLYKSPIIMKEEIFDSSQGKEYFLSWVSDELNSILYSFLRLRLSENSGKTQTGKIIFPELVNCAIIREVHTYGKVQPCKQNLKYYQNNSILFDEFDNEKVQHKGYGKKLLKRAEEIAINNGYTKIAVIAGVGAREYYRNNGYTIDSDEGCYQIKLLIDNNKNINYANNNFKIFIIGQLLFLILILCIFYY